MYSLFTDKEGTQSVLNDVSTRLELAATHVQRIDELEAEVAELRSRLDHRARMGPPSLPGSVGGRSDGKRSRDEYDQAGDP